MIKTLQSTRRIISGRGGGCSCSRPILWYTRILAGHRTSAIIAWKTSPYLSFLWTSCVPNLSIEALHQQSFLQVSLLKSLLKTYLQQQKVYFFLACQNNDLRMVHTCLKLSLVAGARQHLLLINYSQTRTSLFTFPVVLVELVFLVSRTTLGKKFRYELFCAFERAYHATWGLRWVSPIVRVLDSSS
jgi:hypothetical protein